MDRYYTPSGLSDKVIALATSEAPRVIADFAAGAGELLRVAQTKWPRASIVATDIDKYRIQTLRVSQPTWGVGRCDFLSENSRRRCHVLRHLRGNVSLAVLNPPFSYRGAKRWSSNIAGCKVQCSRAMAFVLNAIPFLAPRGEIVAILPISCTSSRADAKAWWVLERLFNVEVLETNGRGSFSECYPTTVSVRLSPGATDRTQRPITTSRADLPEVVLHRGKVQMHSLPGRRPKHALPLAHSTSLRNSALMLGEFYAPQGSHETMSGPVLLLPRVGRPGISKVALVLRTGKFVMSDCLFAFRGDKRVLTELNEMLRNSWNDIGTSYRGTGAPYITAANLAALVRELGFSVVPANGTSTSHQLVRAVNPPRIDFAAEELRRLEAERKRILGS